MVDITHKDAMESKSIEIDGIEFVKVVRCKDCKWCKKRLADTGLKFVYECFFTKDEVQTLDWFCADGEKR